jgi:membrane protease YdiL (CAAX protease family)
MFVVLTGTTRARLRLAAATGEEIDWRGFPVPQLVKVLPFTGVALNSRVIWASWHYPITAAVARSVG